MLRIISWYNKNVYTFKKNVKSESQKQCNEKKYIDTNVWIGGKMEKDRKINSDVLNFVKTNLKTTKHTFHSHLIYT